jgi:hypothetical protein
MFSPVVDSLWQPMVPVKVPMWFALQLQEQKMCTIQVPQFLSARQLDAQVRGVSLTGIGLIYTRPRTSCLGCLLVCADGRLSRRTGIESTTHSPRRTSTITRCHEYHSCRSQLPSFPLATYSCAIGSFGGEI